MSELVLSSGDIRRSAIFSPCRTWRYTLERLWDDAKPLVTFVLLNPSTADESHDDPTNRRGIDFAKRWGYGGVVFVNLFAYRTPHPKVMLRQPDPVGPDNDRHIVEQARKAGVVVAAWGANNTLGRDRAVLRLLDGTPLQCLGTTKNGHPRHPLYLRSNAPLEPYRGPQ